MRRFTTKIPVAAAICWLVGCATPSSPDLRPVIYNSMAQLDHRDINLYKGGPSAARGMDGISGRVVRDIEAVADEMQSQYSDKCSKTPLENHLFFYKDSDDGVRIITMPRSVPEPDNQIRQYVDNEGQPRIALPVSRGAKVLKSCVAEFFVHSDGTVEFKQFHDNE